MGRLCLQNGCQLPITYAIFTGTFSRFLFNSYFLGVVVTVLSVIIGTLAAYGFSRYRFFGDRAAKLFVITTQMVPTITLLIPLFGVIVWLRLYDTMWGLILTYLTFSLPYAVIMMNAYLDTIPKDFDEAATIDGCSPIGVLFKILLPIATPGIISTAVYTFLLAWNEFLFALLLTNKTTRTMPNAMARTIGGEINVDYGLLAAMICLFLIPIFFVTYALQNQLLRGVTFGTIKK